MSADMHLPLDRLSAITELFFHISRKNKLFFAIFARVFPEQVGVFKIYEGCIVLKQVIALKCIIFHYHAHTSF